MQRDYWDEHRKHAETRMKLHSGSAQRCNPHKMFPGSKRCADFVGRKQIAA
jgi:hypothetical protein